jgi:hypothetical protein
MMKTPSTDRIDQLALVWLMVPRTKSGVAGFSDQLKPIAPGAAERKRLANECVARLRERGLLGPGSLLQLTEAGRRSAAEVLGSPNIPDGINLQWAKKVLLLRSMDVAPTPAAMKTAGKAAVLAARIVARRHKVERKTEADPSKVLALLAQRALGLEEKPAAFKFSDVFSAVFWMDKSSTLVGGDSINGHTTPPSSTMSLRLEDCSLSEFAHTVTEAALSSATGRWHGAVFISHVWDTLKAHGEVGISFEKFKRRLIEAHQKDLIELSRADLVEAMPTADVSASETVHSGARFHFVRLDQLAS